MNTVKLPSGKRVPAFGLGTWYMGEDPATHAEELATLRLGLDMGATLIDTAEMYGEGRSEKLVGEAIEGRRDEVFLVDKVLPQNASRRRMSKFCDSSLRRLGTDRIDLYLLHWRGEVPLLETVEAFKELRHAGKILAYGVSNFDITDMEELWSIPVGTDVQTDQVLYNLTRRGIEWDLLPWLRERRVPIMAYSPIERSQLVTNQKLVQFAERYEMTPAQVALAWLLAKTDVIVIPKASQREHLIENLGALEHHLTKAQLAELDRLFPPPSRPVPLEMI
ncbi:aldo/keto reductase [Pedosphaera parvula]|uniref:aldo/keto reductase n=1 Tax=Pedosphaera parvula TaxID=1032527 RepID=UPI000A3084B5|nr:aldo/keto reductase [Pedosphaera parvula]